MTGGKVYTLEKRGLRLSEEICFFAVYFTMLLINFITYLAGRFGNDNKRNAA
jgi:hypothetical protein